MAVFQVPGGELYHEVEGEGVPVVLVHGHALDSRMWDDQMPAPADIARVVRYDARGFGRSTRHVETAYSRADDLWRLLDHLGIEQAVLVGMSMGGRTVVEATLAAPARVFALVLLDALLDGVPWDPESKRGMDALREGLHSGGVEAARAAWFDHGFELLGTITAPTTVVVAELDVPCFRDMSDVLADRIPGARNVTIPDVGHTVNMEAPEAVNALLREVASEAGHPPTDRADCDEHRASGLGG